MNDDIRPLPRMGLNIADAIDKQLGKVPADRTVAFVAVALKEPGRELTAKMAVMVRQGNAGWSFGGYLEGEVKRGLSIGAELRYSR